MRSLGLMASSFARRWIVPVLVMAVAVFVPMLAHAAGVHVAQPHGLSLIGLATVAGTLRHLEPALDYNGLVARRQAGNVNGFRVFPDFLYDTITYPVAGLAAGGALNFFQNVNAANANDKTLTNFVNGTMQAPQMFWIQSMTMKLLTETTAVDDTVNASGGLNQDFDRIITSSRSILNWAVSTSTLNQGNIPLNAVGSMGGVYPTFGGNNVPAAGHGWIYNSPRLSSHGGFPVDIILFPSEVLAVNLIFGVQKAVSVAAGIPIRLECYGWRYIPLGL